MVRRGSVWWLELSDPAGSAPGFSRPAVVVSADKFNATRIDTVVVVLLYSNLRLARHPGNVILSKAVVGLDRDSVANVTQLATVDRQQLMRELGFVPPSLMTKIDSGLRLALQL